MAGRPLPTGALSGGMRAIQAAQFARLTRIWSWFMSYESHKLRKGIRIPTGNLPVSCRAVVHFSACVRLWVGMVVRDACEVRLYYESSACPCVPVYVPRCTWHDTRK